MKISKNIRYNDTVAWRGGKLVRLIPKWMSKTNLKPIGTRYAAGEIRGLDMDGKEFKIILPERIEFPGR